MGYSSDVVQAIKPGVFLKSHLQRWSQGQLSLERRMDKGYLFFFHLTRYLGVLTSGREEILKTIEGPFLAVLLCSSSRYY